MNKNLLKYFCFTAALIAVRLTGYAQWCLPATIMPYSPAMPGITHVVIGSIDRTSADLENYPNNSYVNTGLSTDLIIGNTYPVSITHTIDGTICPDMNLRVWVDYNVDYSFDDAGETVISADHHAPGTYTGTFTVPLTAPTGTTRMRITAKMSNLGGHSPATSCDFPPDPLGYHGEMEDYTVNIVNTTGITRPSAAPTDMKVIPSIVNDHAKISFQMDANAVATIKLCNVTGEAVWTQDVRASSAGLREVSLDEGALGKINPGVYFIQLATNESVTLKKMIKL